MYKTAWIIACSCKYNKIAENHKWALQGWMWAAPLLSSAFGEQNHTQAEKDEGLDALFLYCTSRSKIIFHAATALNIMQSTWISPAILSRCRAGFDATPLNYDFFGVASHSEFSTFGISSRSEGSLSSQLWSSASWLTWRPLRQHLGHSGQEATSLMDKSQMQRLGSLTYDTRPDLAKTTQSSLQRLDTTPSVPQDVGWVRHLHKDPCNAWRIKDLGERWQPRL